MKEYKKNLMVISSHCDTDEKKIELEKNLKLIKDLGIFDIALSSHLHLEKKILEEIDYFIYDRFNIIFSYPERIVTYWLKLFSIGVVCNQYFDDYGWAAINLIKISSGIGNSKKYDNVFFSNYDMDFSKEILEFIRKKTSNKIDRPIFFNMPIGNGEGGIIFNHLFSMVFYALPGEIHRDFVESFDSQEYLRSNITIEEYFSEKVKLLNPEVPRIAIMDKISANGEGYIFEKNERIFSNSPCSSFKIFFGNFNGVQNSLNLPVVFWDILDDMEVIINDKITILLKGTDYLFTDVSSLVIPKLNGEELIGLQGKKQFVSTL